MLGRHEAERKGVGSRLAIPNVRRPRAVQIPKRSAKPAAAFLFAGALLMVSIIDPYSGNMVMAGMVDPYGPNSPGYPQDFSYKAEQQFSFNRGGFTLVSGGSKTAIFVSLVGRPDPGTAKSIAFDYVSKLKWSQAQYSCLVSLWQRESNWRVDSYNKSSGAYGIPQALPGIKMASVASDWQTNPETQIRWGVNYITKRYGTACSALAHSDQIGWY